MSTPEFWASFTHDSLVAPADERTDERADVGPVSIFSPDVPPPYEGPEEPQTLEQSSVNRFCLDDKAVKEKAFEVLEDHYFAVVGDGQSSQAGKLGAITLVSFPVNEL